MHEVAEGEGLEPPSPKAPVFKTDRSGLVWIGLGSFSLVLLGLANLQVWS